jgi:ABC-type branched-subunit amino acid transport system ATPase component/ABC-type branched-subunit amino acid transport system permease subunit
MTTLSTAQRLRQYSASLNRVPARSLTIGRTGVGVIIILALILMPELTSSPYLLSLGAIVAVDAALGMAVVVLMGFAGELSFAYGLLFGAAAYINYEVSSHGWSEVPAILTAMIGAVLIGVLLAIPAARVRGLQLALATFAMGLAGQDIFGRLSGYGGTANVQFFTVFGQPVVTPQAQVVLWGVVVAVLYVFYTLILKGRVGRLFLLLKADEPTARSLGVNTSRARVLAFGLSTLALGLVGGLYPGVIGLLDPTEFSFQTVVTLLIVVFIGGISWPEGALVGAIVVGVIGQVAGSTPGLESVIYGLALVVLLGLAPRGLLGLTEIFERRARIEMPKAEALVTVALDAEPDAGGTAEPPTATRRTGAVEPGTVVFRARGVAKRFGSLRAVDGVDLDITSGEVTAIAGANGAGKSTLLDLLTGFQRADAGEVELDLPDGSRPLRGKRADQVAKGGVVRTFQFPGVVEELTIGQNVQIAAEVAGFGRRRAKQAVQDSLGQVGLAAAEHMSARNLPHGTKKLIDVARVICQQPMVAFFDEPSSGLGSAELPWLARGLRSLADLGSAVVVVEHNMEFIGVHADTMVVLDFGKVIAHGTPSEVLSADVVRRAYLGEGAGEGTVGR